MSLSNMDRNLRTDSGIGIPPSASGRTFAQQIASALETGFAGDPARIKRLARLTGSNERTVKNWFLALNGPNGESLVTLMRHSPDVLQVVLRLAGQEELLLAARVTAARTQLRQALSTLDELLGPGERP